MSRIDVNNLLSQMRQLSASMPSPDAAFARDSASAAAASAPDAGGFGGLLQRSIAEVAQGQQQAGRMAAAFERGDPGADLAGTMVAIQKAQLSLSAANQVRNKLVDAYKDVMNMSI